jgi:hypothetical protein
VKASDIYTLYLKPRHLPATGCDVTISRATVETLHPRPTEEKPGIVLQFKGKNRRLILNQSNANKMVDLGGDDIGGWPGLVVNIKPVSYTKDKQTIVIGPAANNSNGKEAKPTQ